MFAILGLMPRSTKAETVRINATSTSSADLPNAVMKGVKYLANAPGKNHELILEGRFLPTSTIKISWFLKTPLTVTVASDAKAILDGSSLKKGAEVVFMAGQNITLKGIHFTNSQGHSVVVGGNSDRYTIQGCSFRDCQQSAIHVWNDPHSILAETKPRGFIVGNRIARFNLANAKWANDGITVFDQRVVIARNAISGSPTETNGIRAMGRDLVVESNRIKDVSRDDSGGIYLWGGPHASLFRGNMVRWNHVAGASRGIYLDDGTSGALVVENIVERSSVCAIFVSGGRDNTIRRNVVSQAPVFVHVDSRCLGWDSRPEFSAMVDESVNRLRKALMHESGGPLLRKRYAELRQIDPVNLIKHDYAHPKRNRVVSNFVRDVDSNWELMDFSQEVTTDFRALNHLVNPSPFAASDDLTQLNFRKRFGFRGLERLGDVLQEIAPRR